MAVAKQRKNKSVKVKTVKRIYAKNEVGSVKIARLEMKRGRKKK